MSKTKFDLYNDEWLDIVFDHRNKAYGAYDLRLHYGRNMTRAMAMAFAGVAVLVVASIIFRPIIKPVEIVKWTTVKLKDVPPPPPLKAELKKSQEQQVKHTEAPAKASAPVHTVDNRPPVVVPITPPVDPPTIVQLQTAASGSANIEGPATTGNSSGGTGDGKGIEGNGKGKDDNTIYTSGLDVMPEPYGGAAAWSKFLQRTIRYPGAAVDQGVSGKVILSFVIEKDGQLSNIKVDRGVGYGLDEEALRVLKLAKAWKPGMQNGQPVRVKYTIPISFQLGDQ
ncbi:protein TonB [Mucilaginibacter pineti]|uniref:Protein TonB n=1 Tax=Mucilaginibacter pineti TaxID=1391627 RepID=A0A1G7BGM2_9SPHI|nr:energy transducer TonB [Mucilaginibacter pineti]SDE25900.1 protein TonB [Mucilaginibacter pineti]